MTRPEGVSEEVREAAEKTATEAGWPFGSPAGEKSTMAISRAIMEAKQRATERERERCAKVAEAEPEFPEPADDRTQRALDENPPLEVARTACRLTKEAIAAAIRKGGA